jgi:outer membrane immunogenic protein
MKKYGLLIGLCAALMFPVAALSAPGPWNGPFVGLQAGWNRTSLDHFSSDSTSTFGVYGGYYWQVSRHFVVGPDLFYDWNGDTSHQCECSSENFGSHVYGIEAIFGFPVGDADQFMPYLKVGYAHLGANGDLSGSDNGWRAGGGIAWLFTNFLSLRLQYTYGHYGASVNHWRNNNVTIGLTLHF